MAVSRHKALEVDQEIARLGEREHVLDRLKHDISHRAGQRLVADDSPVFEPDDRVEDGPDGLVRDDACQLVSPVRGLIVLSLRRLIIIASATAC